MAKHLAPVELAQLASGDLPASDATTLYALGYGPALRGSGGEVPRLYDIATGVTTSALTNATTTLSDMTGLGIPVVAGGVYMFEFSGTYSTSSTMGYIAAGLNGPSTGATGVSCNLHLHVGVGSDTWHNGCTTAFATSNTPSFAIAANTSTPWRMYGSFHVGATGGTVIPQFCRSGVMGTITIQADAWGWALRIS